MTESNQGPATPGIAARCEHEDVVSTGRDASGVEWGRCSGCGDSTFVIDDPSPNPDGIRCGTFQPKPPGWEHPHMVEPDGGWPEGAGFLSCAPEDCPTCLKRKVAVLGFYKKTERRLKAENASLMESLRATRDSLDAEKTRFILLDAVLQVKKTELAKAEQMAAGSRAQFDSAEECARKHDARATAAEKQNASLLESLRAWQEGECQDCAEREPFLIAAEQRAEAAEKALTELLRLYDWRFVLAEREKLDEHNDLAHANETRRLLRQYGEEKKRAWEAARAALRDEERSPIAVACACCHGTGRSSMPPPE